MIDPYALCQLICNTIMYKIKSVLVDRNPDFLFFSFFFFLFFFLPLIYIKRVSKEIIHSTKILVFFLSKAFEHQLMKKKHVRL